MNGIDITVSHPTQYHIHHKGEWASFIITSGITQYYDGPDDHWVDVIVSSSFTSMSYKWNSIGSTSWADFLNQPGKMEYFMGKFLTYDQLHEWDRDRAIKWASKSVIDTRKSHDITSSEARASYEAIMEIYDEQEFDTTIWNDPSFDNFDYVRFSLVKPWVKNFWETLWVPFMSSLANNAQLTRLVDITESNIS